MSSGSPTSASRAETIRRISSGRLARVLPQRKGDVLGDRHAVEQRRLLKQEAEADPLPGQLPLAQLGQVAAVEIDRRRGWAAAAR